MVRKPKDQGYTGDATEPKKVDQSKDEVALHYIKSAGCLDLPVHGAYGGINPATGLTYMAVFSERTPIPKEITLKLPSTPGQPATETGSKGKEGIIRTIGAVFHL
jgi:hypothetical protein